MRWVVCHTQFACNHLRHARTGPEVAPKAEAFGALRQQAGDALPFCGTQTPGSTGRFPSPECGFASLQTACDPLADRAFGDAERFGNVFLLPARLVQRPGAHPSFFFPTLRFFLDHVAYQTTV
jgi:hypothetical protein